MATIKYVTDKGGNLLHPITEEAAVIGADGTPLSEKLADMGATLSEKQNIIADLETIRAGAASGATSYQKPTTGIPAADLSNATQNVLYNAVLLGDTVGTVSD